MSPQSVISLHKSGLKLNDIINIKASQVPPRLEFTASYRIFATKEDFKSDYRTLRKAATALRSSKISAVSVQWCGLSITVF